MLGDGVAVYTPGVSQRRGGATTYDLHDGLGSAVKQTGSGASVTATRIYDAFGMLLASTGAPQGPFGFAATSGYQADEDTGLQLLGHRYYDPSAGRFLTRDPIGSGRNWYTYCDDNRLRWVDEDGQDPCPPGQIYPPFPLPGAPGSKWVWVPNPKHDPTRPTTDPGNRPGKWVPNPPVKGGKGGQPSTSWDDQTGRGGMSHWDLDYGVKGVPRDRFDGLGNPISDQQAHGPANPGQPKPPTQTGPSQNSGDHNNHIHWWWIFILA